MPVSQRDRDLMRKLGEYKRASHDAAAAQHRALPIDQRLRRSWELYLSGRESARVSAHDDDPSPFYERARARGLYRP